MAGRSSDEHEWSSEKAQSYSFCAAFQPLKEDIFVSERLVFSQKEAPREKKALTFFHADIPFFIEEAPGKQEYELSNYQSAK